MRNFDGPVRAAAAAAMLLAAIVQGCGDDDNPAAPPVATFDDVAATITSSVIAPRVTGPASSDWLWWNGIFIPTARFAPDGSPASYDPGEQAWFLLIDDFSLDDQQGALSITTTGTLAYRWQFMGPGGAQETNEGATSMTFRIDETLVATAADTTGGHYLIDLHLTLQGDVPYDAEARLQPQITGTGTALFTTVSGGDSVRAPVDSLSIASALSAHDETTCPEGTATIAMGSYRVDIAFVGDTGSWMLKHDDGSLLDQPVEDSEPLFCGP